MNVMVNYTHIPTFVRSASFINNLYTSSMPLPISMASSANGHLKAHQHVKFELTEDFMTPPALIAGFV